MTQQEIEELVELLLKYPMVYITSKFDAGKLITPLHLPLNFDAIFKKQRAMKTTVEIPQNLKFVLVKDTTSPRLE